jgi:hemin uptake protein HemP
MQPTDRPDAQDPAQAEGALDPHARDAPPLSAVVPALPRVSSRALLGRSRELEIEHAGALYRLRLTSLNKLILTK